MRPRINGILLAAFCAVLAASLAGAEPALSGIAPCLKNGKKWRAAYFVSPKAFPTFSQFTRGCINGLAALKWMDAITLPDLKDPNNTRDLWKNLCETAHSNYLEFVSDAYIVADAAGCAALKKRLTETKDLDVVFAVGTAAGKEMADNKYAVPTLVMSVSNPLQAGIIGSVTDSGSDFIHARIDPLRYERQVRIFHDIIGFKKLGVVAEDSAEGRTFAALQDVERVAAELHFKVVTRFFKPAGKSDAEKQAAADAIVGCYTDLAREADAVYIGLHGLVTRKVLARVLEQMEAHKLPAFSMRGSEEVRQGVLFSIARADFNGVGLFQAGSLARMLNGASARKLELIYEEPAKIAINLEAARKIGYNPPFEILTVADETFTSIERP